MAKATTRSQVHSAATQLGQALGLSEVQVSINPNLLLDKDNNAIVPSFLLSGTKGDMYRAIRAAMYAVEYYKDLGDLS